VKRGHVGVAERPHLAITAPELERPMIRLAGDVDCVDVVRGFDHALAIDLLCMWVDEAEAVSEHPVVLSVGRGT